MAAELEEKRPSTSDPDDSDGESSASFSLSLCDFPLAGHGRSDCPSFCGDRQLSHPPPTGPFEFLSSDLSAAEKMCSAEDVFLQGKLLPYKPPSPHRYPNKRGDAPDPKISLFDHRRSESLDSISRPRGGGVLATECWRLRKAASDSDPITHLPPPAPRSRPKWYLVAFGSVPGDYGDEGHPDQTEAAEVASAGGVRQVGTHDGERPVEASPVAELQRGGERSRVAAAKLSLTRARLSQARLHSSSVAPRKWRSKDIIGQTWQFYTSSFRFGGSF